MEHSVENSDGRETGKKSRSLDLQSIYKSRVSKEALSKLLKRKHRLDGASNGGEAVTKKRKSRKEVSLSSFEKKSRRNLDQVYSGCGVSSNSNDSDKSSRLIDRISLSLDDNVVKIPRRRRGLVGRKKEVNQLSKSAGSALPTSSKIDIIDDASKLLGDSDNAVVSTRRKRKKGFDKVKENQSSGLNSELHVRSEDVVPVISNGDASSTKCHKNRRKKKSLGLESPSSAEAEPLVNNQKTVCNNLHEDDEENLEQNAARMLSSRFDPNCTGFSSNRKEPVSASDNGMSFAISGGDFVSHGVKSEDGSESPLLDAAGRVLRPRRQHKQKGLSRKRRHFYEILSSDLDAVWVLNRRIKVFWPLDQSWYFGLVNDYDSERKLHHVKYDDRDEEWIDLQNERFKLLLLPSEVPGKADRKKLAVSDKHVDEGKVNMNVRDDSLINSFMESEPIISWLAQSTRRVKSAPSSVSKKQKISGLSSTFSPSSLSLKTVDANECVDVGSSKRDVNKLSSSNTLAERLTDAQCSEKSELGRNLSSKVEKLPRVYFRRRFHKRGQQLCRRSQGNFIFKSSSNTVNFIPAFDGLVDDFWDIKDSDDCWLQVDPEIPFWTTDNAGLVMLMIPLIQLRQFKFALNFPTPEVMNYTLGVDHSLLHALLLLHYGTLMPMWPLVHLEMLFVDDIVGLRFLLFEGCLQQVVAFVFFVLTVFHQPDDQGNEADLQLPVTSIRFKLSCTQNVKRELVFAFYNFSTLKTSKWLYLDSKLGAHCSLMKQLPLSECTHGNIKALQCGSANLAMSPVFGESSKEGLQKRSRPGMFHISVPKESSCVNMSRSYVDEKHGRIPTFSLSFTAAPTFFLGLHLKLLLERSVGCISLQDHGPLALRESLEKSSYMMVDDCSPTEDCSSEGAQLSVKSDFKNLPNDAVFSELLSLPKSDLTDYQNATASVPGTSAISPVPSEIVIPTPVLIQNEQYSHSVSPSNHSCQGKPDAACRSCLNGFSVEIQSVTKTEKPVNTVTLSAQQSSDLCWSINDGVIRSPNPTAPRSMWHRNRNSSSSSSFGYLSHLLPDRKADFFCNGFGNGPKKPRTQVSYTLPFGGHDINTRQRSLQHKGFSHKRIRKANEKRADGSKSSQRDLELVSCDANVLITAGDRGWREEGAQVALELIDHNEWRLSVKVLGTTRYTYKAPDFLQPGTTNRYTHDMMWKGGKDWTLEFPDRSQWMLFKEMHTECYNRNFHAASKKNIPIPGVRLIEETDDNGTEVPFVRISPMYYRQLETDVDMAMNPSRFLYDMDSDDERWILNCNTSDVNKGSFGEISEEMFEKAMNMFEKVAYAQQRDQFTSDELDELVSGVGPAELIKSIYEYWRQKRGRQGMPLIRQLQAPQWERYQQQLRQWELAMSKAHTNSSNGCQEKAFPVDKPPMFAFCLKPRGLEVSSRGSKHRSHRKFSVTGHNNAFLGDQDGFRSYGRRLNGFAACGDEKGTYSSRCQEYSDALVLAQTSARVYSPRDAASTGYFSMSSSDNSERNLYPKFHRSRSRKIGTFLTKDSPRTVGKSNGVHRLTMGEWQSQKHYCSGGNQRHIIEHLDDSDLDEFRLRDASSAAQHAHNMARLKREKAQRLLYRADLAIHKAVVALMTAEAVKAAAAASEDESSDDE